MKFKTNSTKMNRSHFYYIMINETNFIEGKCMLASI